MLLLSVVAARPLGAQPRQRQIPEEVSRARVAAWNVGLTAALTLGRAVLEGEIHSWQGVARAVAGGAVAGGGFYLSKRLIAAGTPWAAVLLARGDRMRFRGGIVYFRSDDLPAGARVPHYELAGQAVAGVPVISERHRQPGTFAHEAIHSIQMLQLGAVTPYYRLGRIADLPGWLEVQVDWLYALRSLTIQTVDYAGRLSEIEAYTLVR